MAGPESNHSRESASPEKEGPPNGDEKPKRKRIRQKASCQPCQRRKTRCDGTDPCSACTKRSEADKCTWDAPIMRGVVPDDIARQFGAMSRRITALENQMKAMQDRGDSGGNSVREESLVENGSKGDIDIHVPMPMPPILPGLQGHDQTPYTLPAMLPSASTSSTAKFPGYDEHVAALQAATTIDFAPVSPPSNLLNGANHIDTDTENAVQALEDLALGRTQYLALGKSSAVACVGLPGAADREIEEETTHIMPQPGAFTTILTLPVRRKGGEKSSIFSSRADQEQKNPLLDALPARGVADALVKEFFTEIGWIYNIIHRPTFLAECEELWQAIAGGAANQIDPAWLSTLYMVLAWTVSTVDPRKPHPELLTYDSSEVASLPETWVRASRRCLDASNFAAKPQIRAIQSILLRISYRRPTSQGSSAVQEESGFFVWLATATRMCQMMGLHRLGKDPSIMPPNDPGLPVVACSLKRQLACRIWSFCATFDWLFCSNSGIGMITTKNCDTESPWNVDDEDLGLTSIYVTERPPTHFTDLSFCKVKLTLARYQLMAVEVSQNAPRGDQADYDTILKLDAALQAEIAALEMAAENSNPRRRYYHKNLLLSILHNRVMRLHRPFFMRGWVDPRYEPSSKACLRSASAIAEGMKTMQDAHLEHFWWVYSYAFGSLVVLFMSSLRHTVAGSPSEKNLSYERSLILSLRQFFDARTGPSSSAHIRQISTQAVNVVDHFLAPRSDGDPGSPAPPVARILRDIHQRVKNKSAPTPLDRTLTASLLFGDTPNFDQDVQMATYTNHGSTGNNDADGSGNLNDPDFLSTFFMDMAGTSSAPSQFDSVASRNALLNFAGETRSTYSADMLAVPPIDLSQTNHFLTDWDALLRSW